eukprot:g3269.t1
MTVKGIGTRIGAGAARLIIWSLLASLVVCSGQELVSVPPPLETFPSVANSTILFLHAFKCGGTTLRQVFMSLAAANGWSGAVVPGCKTQRVFQFYDPPGGYICITHDNQVADQARAKWLVGGTKVMAGHFLWDFRTYVTQPYLLITTLRHPLELFVSGLQFKHRDKTRTLEEAASFSEAAMRDQMTWVDPTQVGFIRGLNDNNAATRVAYPNATVPAAAGGHAELLSLTRAAIKHLGTFFVVGVVEQYDGFIHVMRRTLDPNLEHPSIWEEALKIRNNGSPVHSEEVLSRIDHDVVRRFNETCLGYQWKVYEVALQLWDARCREVLPVSDHGRLCTLPGYA